MKGHAQFLKKDSKGYSQFSFRQAKRIRKGRRRVFGTCSRMVST